ncbi:hypothetical protein NOK12_16820 [Nocardioides sp. OK12]|uniref:hypothetical protein n=1 Tax=Nocardioides sp. OK12 TaxID=2758661 RepID=UPI0021C2DAE7|nr:hypothetical protein [Nocardioides sp. OK12]GHJ59164.1 hypothetical protein NOK12_16820 [Nocardioides sp. OK12]
MTFSPTEPTPCDGDNRWLSVDPSDIKSALAGCLECPALYRPHPAFGGISCTEMRAELIATDPYFPDFEGVMAGEVHDPIAERREKRRERRAARKAATPETHYNANLAAWNAAKRDATHCKRGHEFDEDNTYVDPKGNRACRTCVRAQKAAHRAKQAKNPRPRATECMRGHEFTVENTYVTKDGRQRCRICRRARQKASDLRLKTSKTQPTTRRNNAA